MLLHFPLCLFIPPAPFCKILGLPSKLPRHCCCFPPTHGPTHTNTRQNNKLSREDDENRRAEETRKIQLNSSVLRPLGKPQTVAKTSSGTMIEFRYWLGHFILSHVLQPLLLICVSACHPITISRSPAALAGAAHHFRCKIPHDFHARLHDFAPVLFFCAPN